MLRQTAYLHKEADTLRSQEAPPFCLYFANKVPKPSRKVGEVCYLYVFSYVLTCHSGAGITQWYRAGLPAG